MPIPIEPAPIEAAVEKIEKINDTRFRITLVPKVEEYNIEKIESNLKVAQDALDTLAIQHQKALNRLTATRDLWQSRLDSVTAEPVEEPIEP